MKPVRQTRFGNVSGNCFAACIASILELDLESVPNFCTLYKSPMLSKHEWYDSFLWWCGTLGYSYVELVIGHTAMSDGQLCIVSGKSPRGDFDHCVVGRFENGRIVIFHDPHPSDVGLDGLPKQYGVFIPVDPINNGCVVQKNEDVVLPLIDPKILDNVLNQLYRR